MSSKIGEAIDRHYDELRRRLITREGIYDSPNNQALQVPEGFMSIPADHMAPEMLLSSFENPQSYNHSPTLKDGDIAIWLPGMNWVFFLRPTKWDKDPGGLYPDEVIFTLPTAKLIKNNAHVFSGLSKLGKKFNLKMKTIKPLRDVICLFEKTS